MMENKRVNEIRELVTVKEIVHLVNPVGDEN
jgi:hypothetical protein